MYIACKFFFHSLSCLFSQMMWSFAMFNIYKVSFMNCYLKPAWLGSFSDSSFQCQQLQTYFVCSPLSDPGHQVSYSGPLSIWSWLCSGEKQESSFIILYSVIRFEQHHLLKMLSAIHIFYIFVKDIMVVDVGAYMWVFSSIPLTEYWILCKYNVILLLCLCYATWKLGWR